MTVHAPALDRFPLAEGITQRIADATDELVQRGTGLFVEDVSPITAELLKFWFHRDYVALRRVNFHQGQRDAVLAIIFAHEILGSSSLEHLYREIAPHAMLGGEVLGEITAARNRHPKYAAKMATGTGKTWVLNALMIWQHLNHLADKGDERFSSNFLLVAPGLIVYERLLDSFLGRVVDGQRDFTTSDIYDQRLLFVPDTYQQQVFGFLQSSVVAKKDIGRKATGSGLIAITNWHLLTGEDDPEFADDEIDDVVALGGDFDESEMAKDILPLSPGVASGNSLEVLDRRHRRGEAIQFLKELPSLVVFNDEAHHIHSLKKGDEQSEVEWQKSLTAIATNKGRRFTQVDFSATPYNEVSARGGGNTKKFFPHIVVDFDVRTAMRQGLVKTLLLDKRKEIAALPLDFKAERDSSGVLELSDGQRVMLRAGIARLSILEQQFTAQDKAKHPKMMVICEDTTVVPLVEEFLYAEGFSEEDVLSVHSGKKSELGEKEWIPVRERLFALDKHQTPKIVVSVLMLREGFDVNNICVIVPLRSATASILLEQTIGRGLRLMWRGDSSVDELKAESRKLIAQRLAPTNYFDMLFIVEHPRFQEFYDDLIEGGLAGEVGEDGATARATGDLELVSLRDGFEKYDFEVPFVVRDADEEMKAPSIDPLALDRSKFPLADLLTILGKGDIFVAETVENKTQFGDYRVDGGVMTATGYNDYLSRMANRIAEAHGRAFVSTTQQYKQVAAYPVIQQYKQLLVGWINVYIRNKMFGAPFDPLADENWRVLLLPDVAAEIAGCFGTLLVQMQENVAVDAADVMYRFVSEVDEITVRASASLEVTKCIYPRLGYPTHGGGLERDFLQWADADGNIEAFVKLHEYKHDFMRRPYLKADGMPAQYSPDFLLRSRDSVFVVETKAQSGLSDVNVRRKQRSALAWCSRINALDPQQREHRSWFYVLAGESGLRNHMNNGGTLLDYLNIARLVNNDREELGQLF
jgi:type III restriction enzyme